MNHKTPEIIRTLELASDPFKRFKREDVTYSKLHPKEKDSRKDLRKISLDMLNILEERGLVSEDGAGFYATKDGVSLLDEFKSKKRELGKDRVMIVPVSRGRSITYGVSISEDRYKTEIKSKEQGEHIKTFESVQTSEESDKKIKFVKFAQRLKSDWCIKDYGVDNRNGLFTIYTGLSFHRTTQEVSHLNEIATGLGTGITPSGNEYEMEYDLRGNHITILSKKKMKSKAGFRTAGGFGSYEPLRIEINPNHYSETVEKTIEDLLQALKK